MDYKRRNEVWSRDDGICQNCKKELFKTIDPYEEIIDELLTLQNIPIFKWSEKCWKCQKETSVVSYDFAIEYNFHIGDIKKLDDILIKNYSFVKRVFSKTMSKEVVANICVHCGSLQGNWFIRMDLIKMASKGIEKKVDMVLPNNLQFDDLLIDRKELEPFFMKLSIGHIHHKDRNRENNDLNNLILLCRNCHVKVHSNLRKGKV